MYILASDFDGTLRRHDLVDDSDLAAIDRFRSAGNLFGLVTGRSPRLIEPDFRRNPGLHCDFRVLSTGSVVLDGEGKKVLYENPIPVQVAHAIADRLFELGSDHFGFSDMYSNYLFKKGQAWEKYKERLMHADYDETPDAIFSRKKVLAFVICEPTMEQSVKMFHRLTEEFGDKAEFHFNNGSIDISAKGATKSSGVAFVEKHFGMKAYTIGDERNDVDMLRDFGGFAVSTGCEEAKKAASHVVDSVEGAIDFLMGQK